MTPGYQEAPAQTPRKQRMPLWGVAVLVGCLIVPLLVILILAAILFPVFTRSRDRMRGIVCLDHSKKIGVAALLYAQDYDDVLPPKNGPWVDMLTPYAQKDSIEVTAPTKTPTAFQCPSVDSGPGYAISTKAAGLKLSKLVEPYTVRMIFDSDVPGRNAFAAPDAVAYRHADQRGSIVFADGHAKSLTKSKSD